MKTPALLLVLVLLAGATPLGASDYSQDYAKLKTEVPAEKMEAHLADWRKREPDNPDGWILSANWYFEQAQRGLVISTKKAGADDFAVVDPKTNKAVGSISTSTGVDPEKANRGAAFLREALTRWPHRLDIHGGLAHMMQESGQWVAEIDALRAMAAAAKAHASKLRWCHDEPLEMPEDEFLALRLHKYALVQFEKETPEGDEHFREIAQLIVEACPAQPYGHNDLANYYGLSKNWPEAQKVLETAAKIAPNDALVWLNLGDNSARLGDRNRALEAFEHVLKLEADADLKKAAREAIGRLKAAPAAPKTKRK